MPSAILLATHEFLPYPGGVGRYCAALANAAAEAGYEVDVVAPDHGYAETPAMHDRCRLFRFPGGQFSLRDRSVYTRLIAARLAGRQYSIIHAADNPAILAAASLPARGARRIATVFGTDVLMFRRSLRWRLAGAGRALAAFEHLACISAFTQQLLAKQYPKVAARSTIVPLGVDQRWFMPADGEALTQLRQRFELQDDQTVILSVARIDRRKGQDFAIRALARLPVSLRTRLRYLCIGREVEQDYARELRELAERSGVRLILAGQLPDAQVHAAYSIASALSHTATAQPDRVEGFGLVLLEAAAAGLPAVVTPVDAIPEVIVPGQTGLVAADAGGLAQAFESLLTSDRGALREACIAQARRYSWNACVTGTYGTP